jgi:hypothetical protein
MTGILETGLKESAAGHRIGLIFFRHKFICKSNLPALELLYHRFVFGVTMRIHRFLRPDRCVSGQLKPGHHKK